MKIKKNYKRSSKALEMKMAVGMRRLPTALFYMITASFKAKICTAYFTANQSTKAKLKNFTNSYLSIVFVLLL